MRPPAGVDLHPAERLAGLRAAFRAIEAGLPPFSLAGVFDRAAFSAPHSYACGAGRDYLVIDWSGRVARCQMEMNRPVAHIAAPDLLEHGGGTARVRHVATCTARSIRNCCGSRACGCSNGPCRRIEGAPARRTAANCAILCARCGCCGSGSRRMAGWFGRIWDVVHT